MKSLVEYIASKLNENLVKTKFRGKNVLFHATWLRALLNILDTDTLEGRSVQIRQATGTRDKLDDMPLNQLSDMDAETLYKKYEDKKIKGISLSRNWNFNFQNADMQLILDGEKLKRKFGKKLAPIDYFGNHDNHQEWGDDFPIYMKKWDVKRPKDSVESEEFLAADEIKQLHEYILGFIINIDKKKEAKKTAENIDIMLKNIEAYVKNYKMRHIPIYWQDGDLMKTLE